MEEVWSTINFRNLLVIDVGVGYSTRKLVELGAKVVGVDVDFKPLMKLNDLKIPLMKCNFIKFPFKTRVADLVLFFFTLHEVDPQLHGKFIQTARQVAPKIMIVEPSPHGCPEYLEYARDSVFPFLPLFNYSTYFKCFSVSAMHVTLIIFTKYYNILRHNVAYICSPHMWIT